MKSIKLARGLCEILSDPRCGAVKRHGDVRGYIARDIDDEFELAEEAVYGETLDLNEADEFAHEVFPGTLFAIDAFEPNNI